VIIKVADNAVASAALIENGVKIAEEHEIYNI